MINGHTHGQYLDDPALLPFWERAEALGAMIYLHPADPVAPLPVLGDYKVLHRPMWGWGVETGSHALRLVVSGAVRALSRRPSWCSAISARRCRSCSGASTAAPRCTAGVIRSCRRNTSSRISGSRSPACSHASRSICALDALGRDRVMFSADHPFENALEAGHFMDTVPLDEALRADVAYNNAAKLLGV